MYDIVSNKMKNDTNKGKVIAIGKTVKVYKWTILKIGTGINLDD